MSKLSYRELMAACAHLPEPMRRKIGELGYQRLLVLLADDPDPKATLIRIASKARGDERPARQRLEESLAVIRAATAPSKPERARPEVTDPSA